MEWRDVPGWEIYEISDFGNVRRKPNTLKCRHGRALKTHINDKGYPCVHLRHLGCEKTIPIHVAILLAFVGPKPSPKHHGAHTDGNPKNSILGNLRWATPLENAADKIRHGRQAFGEKHHTAKLPYSTVQQIFNLSLKMSSYEVSKVVGCSDGHVRKILRGERRNAEVEAFSQRQEK